MPPGFRAIGGQKHAPLFAHGFRHGKHHVVAAGGADHGDADARVAARRLHEHALAGRYLPARFCGINHAFRGAVFDRPAGVGGLVFHEHVRAHFGAQLFKLDQRRCADGGAQMLGHCHTFPSWHGTKQKGVFPAAPKPIDTASLSYRTRAPKRRPPRDRTRNAGLRRGRRVRTPGCSRHAGYEGTYPPAASQRYDSRALPDSPHRAPACSDFTRCRRYGAGKAHRRL